MNDNIPTQPLPANHYVELGKLIALLHHTNAYEAWHISGYLKSIMEILDVLEYGYPKTQWDTFAKRVKDMEEKLRAYGNKMTLPKDWEVELQTMVRSVAEMVRNDGRTSIILFPAHATILLRQLDSRLSEDSHKAMLQTVVRSLECGVTPAAVVMAWNLTYDYIRWWIVADPARLADLNTQLATTRIVPNRIAAYTDFFELGERQVVDQGYHAKLYSKQQHQILADALNMRNHHAHVTPRALTKWIANAYIENLVVNILTALPFSSGLLASPP